MTSMYAQWIAEMTKLAETRERNIKTIRDMKPFDQHHLSSLDDTPDNLTAFTKKLKNISTSTIYQLLPDLDKLNLSKYLDEIAANICGAAIDCDISALVDFNVNVAALYKEFPMHLLNGFEKQLPLKTEDKVGNSSRLLFVLRFFTELLLNGLFNGKGHKLLNQVILFLISNDRQLNLGVLIPFCKEYLFYLTGILPFSIQKDFVTTEVDQHSQLISPLFTNEQRMKRVNSFNDYWQSLVKKTMKAYDSMNRMRMSMRQKRARGDASFINRQFYDQVKQQFENFSFYLNELSECLGHPPIEFAIVEEQETDADAPLLTSGVEGVSRSNNLSSGSNVDINIVDLSGQIAPSNSPITHQEANVPTNTIPNDFNERLSKLEKSMALTKSGKLNKCRHVCWYYIIPALLFLIGCYTFINLITDGISKNVGERLDLKLIILEDKIDKKLIALNTSILENMDKKLQAMENKTDQKLIALNTSILENMDKKLIALNTSILENMDKKFQVMENNLMYLNSTLEKILEKLNQ
ncbi:hypothetical protein ACQ4LE_001809 [Meloidogyne hapla]|uniref:Uncharacterized protein n=1 Tax=Meloidogyne hapla TaxID=6305 RepID=A0A1I8BAD2_MELHA